MSKNELTKEPMTEAPIQNVEEIDVIAKRVDGGVDTVVIVSSFLDDTPEMEALLKQKIQNYVEGFYSEEFEQEFGTPETTNYSILIKCSVRPHDGIFDLVKAVADHLAEFGIQLKIET
jgi:hypothetical protein